MKDKFKIFKPEDLFSLLYGVITVCVLAFSLLSLNDILVGGHVGKWYLFSAFLFLALSRGLLSIYYFMFNKTNKIAFFKNNAFTLIYIVLAILIVSLFKDHVEFYQSLAIIYLFTIIVNRICLIFEKKCKPFHIVYNSIIVTLVFFIALSIALAGNEEYGDSFISLLIFIILIVSFIEVLAFAFAKIQLRGLLRIIRETYVLEILYGLVILIVSFSFYFMVMEEDIKTFGDGLWFSFGIVTTIGLGDITVKSFIGRTLAVILGMYGLVVVAAITSVFVNFYKESKGVNKKEAKELEQKEESQPEKDKEK